MFKNEVKIDPKDMLDVIRTIERDTAKVIVNILRNELMIPVDEFTLKKIASRFGLRTDYL